MSLPAATGPTGLPAVNQALEPAWVRRGSTATQKAYTSALAFEQTLVEQLSQSLAQSSGLDSESSQEGGSGSEEAGSLGGEAGASQLSSMLPQALTASVMNAGGLGLAAQMTHELEAAGGATQARANGGTAPGGTGDGAATAGAEPAASTTSPTSGGTGA
jgi:Rod binding domain-containing protein